MWYNVGEKRLMPSEHGKGETMSFTKLFLVLSIALTLSGISCKRDNSAPQNFGSQPQDAATVTSDASANSTPQGWKVYKGATLEVVYPSTWYVKEDVIENPNPPGLQRVFFDPQPIPEERETEPVYLAMLEAWPGTVAEVLKRYPVDDQNTITIGSREVTRFTYGADFFGESRPVAYVFEEGGNVYLIQRFDGNSEHLETMIRTLEVR